MTNILEIMWEIYPRQISYHNFFTRVNMVNSHFKGLPVDVAYHLFKCFCMPLYGSQSWDLSSTAINSFFISWRKSIRRVLKLPRQTHCALLHLICDDIHVSYQMYSRCIKFCRSVFNSDNSIVKYCAKLAMSGSRSVMSNNLSNQIKSNQIYFSTTFNITFMCTLLHYYNLKCIKV